MIHSLRALALVAFSLLPSATDEPGKTLTGKDALGDWTTDAPGVRRKITTDDLATPYDTPSANNGPKIVKRPEGAWPKAPEGFEVTEFATGLTEPRVIVRAPNGDLFVSESQAGRVRVLRDKDGDGKLETSEVFAKGLRRPFGIAGPYSQDSPSPVPSPMARVVSRVAAGLLTEAACDASAKGWLLNKGAGWWDGNYLNTLYNHRETPNSRRPDCIVYHKPGWKAARSHHPGGVNTLFCDGHVAFAKDSVDVRVWRAVATRSGGEIVPGGEF